MDDKIQAEPPPPLRVDRAKLAEVRDAVCEIYERAADDMRTRSPIERPIAALGTVMADLREVREGLIDARGVADPTLLRQGLLAAAAYLVRATVQLQLPAPVRLTEAAVPPQAAERRTVGFWAACAATVLLGLTEAAVWVMIVRDIPSPAGPSDGWLVVAAFVAAVSSWGSWVVAMRFIGRCGDRGRA